MSQALQIWLLVPYVLVWAAGFFLQWSVSRRLRELDDERRPAWLDRPHSLAGTLGFLKFLGRKEYLIIGDAGLVFRCAVLRILIAVIAVCLILGAVGLIVFGAFEK